jgi:alpha-mannosidase
MSLTPEWLGRINHWKLTLERLSYVELGKVPLSGFTTRDQLTPKQALTHTFRPMPVGTRWGAKWEYAWMRGSVTLPPEAAGERIVFHTADSHGFFGEGRVLVNGREAGGRDRQHREILLTTRGKTRTRYAILMEMYAGHGATECGGGPSPEGHLMVPEPPAQQQTVGEASFGIWQEDCFQAWIDLTTLLEVRDSLDANSLRVAEIDAALRDFTTLADLELPRAAMLASIRAGRRRLQTVLACRNGSTAPVLDCFGHSHIDVAWLWPLAETERKCARTFATQLALMEQYPEFKFFQSQPHLYRMTARLYPELYARIKAAVRKGQWLPEGGMWVEADTNITSGESLVRQFIHGKRFFRDEFGIESELMWLPDVFGYSGAMPQIMAGCGIKYFSTQKIFWTYNGGDCFPYNTFWWEGIDGTRVLSHLHNDYNSPTNPGSLAQRWNQRVQKDGLIGRMVPFGFGDGGGGPTREHLEYLRRQQDLEGVPKTRMAGPVAYLRAELKRNPAWPTYVGELYFQAHRGTYTSQARTKRGNRKSEFALREAELWSVAAMVAAGFRYPYAVMDEAWKGVLLNQFHDIIPGSSIGRVYAEAEALYDQVLTTARDTAAAAARKLTARKATALTVFNSLAWDRTALVELPKGWRGATLEGRALPTQVVAGTTVVAAPAPSCGWATLERAKPAATPSSLRVTTTGMENAHLRLTLNPRGEITSLVLKKTGQELAAAPLNSFRMYKDVPRWFDAWDIDSTYKAASVALPGKATVDVVTAGPLVGIIRVVRMLNQSRLEQEIRLGADSGRVDFRTRIDWHEKHKLLKVNFPTNVHANEAIHEIQFGHLRRPNHASRPFDADRFEVSNHKWTALAEENRGAAVLNDCKYGVNVDGGSINLTLLRATQAPDMNADQGLQEFTYAFHAWTGPFFESGLIREAYDLNVPIFTAPGAAGTRSLLTLDAPNVIVETVKPAEDRSGDVIVRLYESKHAATSCTLTVGFPVKAAATTNMLEADAKRLTMKRGALNLAFRPFEIKTVRLTPVAQA